MTRRNLMLWLLAGSAVIVVARTGYRIATAEGKAPVVKSQATHSRKAPSGGANKISTPQLGVVTGIVHPEQDPCGVTKAPSAIVGIKIVHAGDTIDGVKVVEISRGRVEFEKDGERWTQGIQEEPNSAWDEPEQ